MKTLRMNILANELLHENLLLYSIELKLLTLSVLNFRVHLLSAFFLNKLSLGKKFICKVERLNVKQCIF